MPRIPFPHILTEPKFSNCFSFRFVQPEQVGAGDIIYEHSHVQENLNTREFEPVYNCYLIKEIYEQRSARGDWSAYETHPTYYATKGEFIGQQFKSQIHSTIIIDQPYQHASTKIF